MNTPLDGTLTHNTGGWAMELSKTQIDEFTVHLQHEFWSITEGREVLAPGEAKNLLLLQRHHFYTSFDPKLGSYFESKIGQRW